MDLQDPQSNKYVTALDSDVREEGGLGAERTVTDLDNVACVNMSDCLNNESNLNDP